MTVPKFSDEDVALVAQALWDQTRASYAGNARFSADLPAQPTSVCYTDARAVLERLAESGRLLPPGGEVSYRIVWTGGEGTYVDSDVEDLEDGRDHLAIIRGLSFVKEARLERRYVSPWEVVPDDSEKGAGDG